MREYAKNVIYFGCKKSFWDEIWAKALREVDEGKSKDGERGAIESVRIDTRYKEGSKKERGEREKEKEGQSEEGRMKDKDSILRGWDKSLSRSVAN